MFVTSQNYSGTYNFAPGTGEMIMAAYGRIGVRAPEILAHHIRDAVMELNLLLARISNLQPNLWTVDLQSLPLTESQATYSLPAETVMITNAFLRTGTTDTTDRLLFPMSQTEYAGLADKTTEGPPSQFWFNRAISPTITFYLVPDGEGPYTVYYYRVRQVQDATVAGGYNVEIPYLWLDAATAGLAHRLARLYRQDLEGIRKQDADEAWEIAATQNTENVPMYIVPDTTGYYR